ncbi:MAG: hypothetical protein ABFR32_08040 [Bacteroidota bacterium]
MKFSFLFFAIIFFSFNSNSFAQDSFPESWVGNYKGDLSIYSVDSVRMRLNMELKIAKTTNDSIFKWTIIYDFKGKKDSRAYELIVVDKLKGIYKIDEKNSIVIDAYLHNNKVFTSFFKVSESFIIATYTKEKESLIFEIIASKSNPVSITGNTKQGEEEIPEVETFPIDGRQKATLIKVK